MSTMKNVYLLTILYFQNSLCTIDISIPEYKYLSQRLTPAECRRLYTSLHFTTYDLPVEKSVPNAPCLQLLTKWDKGTKKYEGKSKSHVDVVRRLRQIGRGDLAEWLSNTVLTKLAKDVKDALNTSFSNRTEKVQHELDKVSVENEWTMYDAISWAVIAGLTIILIILFGRILSFCCKKKVVKKAKQEEIMELLSYGSLDSDQETIYECVLKNNRVRNKIDE